MRTVESQLYLKQLIAMLNLPERGYTPNNYQALVKLSGLSNADFYREFDIPEQTFYKHYKGTRTMKWQDWKNLYDMVEVFSGKNKL